MMKSRFLHLGFAASILRRVMNWAAERALRTGRPIDTSSGEALRALTWRRAYEGRSACGWAALLALDLWLMQTARVGGLAPAVLAAASAALVFWRLAAVWGVLSARANLAGRAMELIDQERFARRMRDRLQKEVWFGLGFDWEPEHAQKLYEAGMVSVRRLVPGRWLRRLLTGVPGKDPASIGSSLLHGIGAAEADIRVPEKTLEGGTLLVGTTQCGKGVMMNVLVTQAILRGDAVVVIDPKNSPRLRSAVAGACRLAGREPPYVFHPAGGAAGVRINPLASFTRTSEIASRVIAALGPAQSDFHNFAWQAVNVIASLIVFTGRTPTLAGIYRGITRGVGELLMEAIRTDVGDAQFEFLWNQAAGKDERERQLAAAAAWTELDREQPVIEEAVSVLRHDPEHYGKIIASIVPILAKLTGGALRDSLSPEPGPGSSLRPSVTLERVVAERGVLYVAMDALPDPEVASAIGGILLADLASLAGERYNRSQTAAAGASRVCLFVDECANVINRPLIEILNKGAESGIRTTCAMQTINDLAARLGSRDEARMALGNMNTVIALRTKDADTQKFVAEAFGKTYIARVDTAISSGSRTGPAGEFSASVSRRMTSSREDIIPTDQLGALPNTEFFASLAGGRIVKGRVPILICNEE